MKKLICITFLSLFSILILEAQAPSYRNITTKDGLPSSTVYQIKQDKKGFIWIATANGLVRYDGKYFKAFNPDGIKDKEIVGVFIDNVNKVWFWNLRGRLFSIEEEAITIHNFGEQKLNIINFEQDGQGHYYFLAKGKGLFTLENNGKPSLITYRVRFYNLTVINDTIHYSNNSRSLRIAQKEIIDSMTTFDSTFLLEKKFGNFRILVKYLNNKIWVIHQFTPEVYEVNNKGKRNTMGFSKYKNIFGKDILNLFSDNQKKYWLITTKSIFIFDSTESKLERQFSLPNNNTISGFLHDREGNYWISTEKNGLFIIPNIDIKPNNIQSKSIKTPFVSSLSITNNHTILCGLSSGELLIKSLKDDKEQLIDLKIKNTINKIINTEKSSWILTPVRLFSLNHKTFKLKKFYDNPVNINYKTIYEDEALLYIGNYAGVLKINKNTFHEVITTEEWVTIQNKYAIKGIKKRTYAIGKVKNEVWFGTTDGLYHYQKDSAILTTIPELQNTWITQIINKHDTVWIGTQTDGLFQVINKKVTRIFNEKNGLISNNCKTLTIDNNTIWIGTNNGINSIDIKTNHIESINNLDGLPDNDINALVTYENKIYIGTAEGLTNFDKTISTKNTAPPPIYLSKFQIFETDTILSNNYILDYDQTNIRIHFIGVSFRSQGTFTYKYRMKGISDKWIKTPVDMASYPILNPGDYIFEAYAINEDGIESEEPIRIQIHIKTPFWKTWWFTILCFLTGFLLVWAILWYRFKQIEEKSAVENKFQQQIRALEMQALQAQMNPHFIFNALNAIQHYLTIGKGETAMIFLAKFAKLIRMIFEYSKKNIISLTQEVEFLQLYIELEKLRFKEKVDVEFIISEDIYTDEMDLPPLLIQPMIENAFKHGLLHKKGQGHLKIHFYLEGKFLKCSITDNGIGREKTKNMKNWKGKIHQSSGLSTTEKRLKIWTQSNQFESNIFEGVTIFEIIDMKAGTAGIGTKIKMVLGIHDIEEF